jgi:hypothetical protein
VRWLAASREACAGSGEQADNAGGEGLVADGALHDGVDRVAATTVLEDGCWTARVGQMGVAPLQEGD